MRLTRKGEHQVVVTAFPHLLASVGVVAVFAAGVGIASEWSSIRVEQRWLAVVVGVLVTSTFLFASKRARFTFDRQAGLVLWSRRGLWSRQSGVIPFDELRGVALERSAGDGGELYRIAVVTKTGTVPVTVYYESDTRGRIQGIHAQLAEFLRTG